MKPWLSVGPMVVSAGRRDPVGPARIMVSTRTWERAASSPFPPYPRSQAESTPLDLPLPGKRSRGDSRRHDASKEAVAIANEAKALHDAGKHAESVAKAQEAAAAINLTLKMKK